MALGGTAPTTAGFLPVTTAPRATVPLPYFGNQNCNTCNRLLCCKANFIRCFVIIVCMRAVLVGSMWIPNYYTQLISYQVSCQNNLENVYNKLMVHPYLEIKKFKIVLYRWINFVFFCWLAGKKSCQSTILNPLDSWYSISDFINLTSSVYIKTGLNFSFKQLWTQFNISNCEILKTITNKNNKIWCKNRFY